MRVVLHFLICVGIAASFWGTAVCTAELFTPETSVVTSLLLPGPEGGSNGISVLPYTIPGTDLQIQSVTAYEGPYLEDGTYEEVSDVAALVVANTSEYPLQTVEISLYTLRRTLEFSGSWIPARRRWLAVPSDRSY